MRDLLEANLDALSKYNKTVSNYIRGLSLIDLPFEISRTGKVIPQQLFENKYQGLHSLYDPEKEAYRGLEEYESTPCLCFLGFGGGYWIQEALKSKHRELVALWDPFPESSWSILKMVDFTNVFSDPRFRILLNPPDLRLYYYPILMGSFKILPLIALERTNLDIFTSIKTEFQSVLEEIKNDQSTQGKLGSRWIKQTWANLVMIGNSTISLPENKKIWIAGAGPSLETQIKDFNSHDLLFSTDTALPYLRAIGLEPNLVITLDPQVYSYLHYLPSKTSAVFLGELGVFPALARHLKPCFFFYSFHPLHFWLREQGLVLPVLETRSGNVVGSLLDLADSLHPQEIILAGVDLCFPQGKIYARGTYQFDYHNENSSRLTPLENIQIEQIFSGEIENLRQNSNYPVYSSFLQKKYKSRLKNQGLFTKLTVPMGLSPPLEMETKKKKPEKKVLNNIPMDISKLKRKYYTEIYKLSPEKPLLLWHSKLKDEEILIWNTIVPWLAWKVFHGQEINWENWTIMWQELKTILMIEG